MCLVLYEFVFEETLYGMDSYDRGVCVMYRVRYYGFGNDRYSNYSREPSHILLTHGGFLVIYLIVRTNDWCDNLLQPHTNRDSFIERSLIAMPLWIRQDYDWSFPV